MLERFVICDHGKVEASLVPHRLLDRPGMCPYGVYDTFLMAQGEVLDWEAHWDRLKLSCTSIAISSALASEMVSRAASLELAEAQGLENGFARLRVQVFAEPHPLETGVSITFLAAVWPVLSKGIEPITAAIGRTVRQHGDHRYNHKLLGRSYIEEEVDAAALRHCSDVIFCNNNEQLCEGSYSNLWLISEDILITPPITAPCLPGVTRSKTMSAAKGLGITVEERDLNIDDLLQADGMFLTSSIRGIQLIGEIENLHILPEKREVARMTGLLADSLLMS